MDKVQPKIIPSPVPGAGGAPMKPRIMKFIRGNNVVEEAHWYCPVSNQFVQKGVISITPKEK